MVETEIQNLSKIDKNTNLDTSIIMNTGIQTLLCLIYLIIFFFIRPYFPWLYSPNTRVPNHPCYGLTGRFSWAPPLWRMPDTTMLSLIGLDAFAMLVIMRLFYQTTLVCAVFSIPLIFFFYTKENTKSKFFYTRVSALNIPSTSASVIIVFYACLYTAVVFYFVFIYYRHFVRLRQAYLRNPSFLTGVATMRRLSFLYGSTETATKNVDIIRNSILIRGLPSTLRNDADFRDYLNCMGVSGVKDCVLCVDMSELDNLVFKMDRQIRELEKFIDTHFAKMNETVVVTESDEFSALYMSIERKTELFNYFLALCSDSKNTKVTRSGDNDDSSKQDKTIDQEKLAEIKKSVVVSENYLKKLSDTIEEIIAEKKRLEIFYHSVNPLPSYQPIGYDFLSTSSILLPPMHFRALLPQNTRTGIATLESARSADLLSQAILSCRPFGEAAERAPAPHDVLWDNLHAPAVSIGVCRLLSLSFYVILIGIFAVGVVGLSNVLKPSFFIRFNMSPVIRDTLDGLVTPFVYNQLLYIVPVVLLVFIRTEGIPSVSQLNAILLHRYAIFLFFNGFLLIIVSYSFLDIVVDMLAQRTLVSKFLADFSNSLIECSHFFFNLTVQKGFVGNSFFLLNPIVLISNLITNFIFNRTRRERIESRYPEGVSFAVFYPMQMLVFPTAIVYATTSPFMLLPAALHFLFAYAVLRNEFVYASSTDHESGGAVWPVCVAHVCFSVFIMHFATAAYLFANNAREYGMVVILLLAISIAVYIVMQNIFSGSMDCVPINAVEEDCVSGFIEKYADERENWNGKTTINDKKLEGDATKEKEGRGISNEDIKNNESVAARDSPRTEKENSKKKIKQEFNKKKNSNDVDSIELVELGLKRDAHMVYPYRDPYVSKSSRKIIFPKGFFITMNSIAKKNGK